MNIVDALTEAGWFGEYIGITSDAVSRCGTLLGGVLVLSKAVSEEELDDFKKPRAERTTALTALIEAFNSAIGDNEAGFAACPALAPDVLQVVVAPRWISFSKKGPDAADTGK
jgi:hypothetical protein